MFRIFHAFLSLCLLFPVGCNYSKSSSFEKDAKQAQNATRLLSNPGIKDVSTLTNAYNDAQSQALLIRDSGLRNSTLATINNIYERRKKELEENARTESESIAKAEAEKAKRDLTTQEETRKRQEKLDDLKSQISEYEAKISAAYSRRSSLVEQFNSAGLVDKADFQFGEGGRLSRIKQEIVEIDTNISYWESKSSSLREQIAVMEGR